MNESDSERIAAVLESNKYKASDINEADLVVINMCSVRQSAVDRVYGLIPKLKEQKTILTGCILKKDKNKLSKEFDYVLDIRTLPHFVRQNLDSLMNKHKNLKLKNATKWPIFHKSSAHDYLKIKPKYSNNSSACIPIMTGCNNFCSYCVVPYVRGREISRPVKEIICEVKNLVKQNTKEIWLLGQNVNSYKKGKTDFPKLLKMVSNIPGDFSIRFMSPHPKDFSDELINVMAEYDKISKYLNLPIQSGDDKILKKMNRKYTVNDYKKLVEKIRKKMPDINLSTDIIVGFPRETKRQFENTVKLFKEIKFNMAYISKYSARPGTSASKLKDNVSIQEKKRRERVLKETIKKKSKKLIVILGPTASGKTDLSIKLAEKFSAQGGPASNWNGIEVVSADSRQVYKGMDIGTGKITKKEMKGIPHYLLDIASPKRKFTVAQYQKLANKAINKIHKKKSIPFLVGGTAFYIQSIVDGIIIPEVKPDWKLRKELEKKTSEQLFKILKKLDPIRSKTIEKNNKRRLIRAIEIIKKTKRPIPLLKKKPQFETLILGVKKDNLKELIKRRLLKRLKQGMVAEVKNLNLSWRRLEEFGLEYRNIALYLQKKITYQEMIDNIQKESEQFSKRQMTWFKKDSRIKWIKDYKESEKLTKDFLAND